MASSSSLAVQTDAANAVPVFFYRTNNDDEQITYIRTIVGIATNIYLPTEKGFIPMHSVVEGLFGENRLSEDVLQFFFIECLKHEGYMIVPQDEPLSETTMVEQNASHASLLKYSKIVRQALHRLFPGQCSICLHHYSHLYMKTCMHFHHGRLKVGRTDDVSAPHFKRMDLRETPLTDELFKLFALDEVCKVKEAPRTRTKHNIQRAMINELYYISAYLTMYDQLLPTFAFFMNCPEVDETPPDATSKLSTNPIEDAANYLNVENGARKSLVSAVLSNIALEAIDECDFPNYSNLLTNNVSGIRVYLVDQRTKTLVFHTE